MRRGRRRFSREPNKPRGPRVNRQIRVPTVLLIDEHGDKVGEIPTREAYEMAQSRGLDLIEVAPQARPPVCRIADYGKMKYEKQKREAAAKKRQHQVQVKEVKLRPKTDEHDLNFKIRHAQRFLEEGNKVKVTVRFRGREHAHREIGVSQCELVADECSELSVIEVPPKMDGRQMTMILAPTST